MQIVERLAIGVIDRLGPQAKGTKRKGARPAISKGTAAKHQAFQDKEELVPDRKEGALFNKALGDMLAPRATTAAFLKLAEAKKKHGWSWQTEALVLSVG